LPEHQSEIPSDAIKYAYQRYQDTWGEGWKQALKNRMQRRDLLAADPSTQTNAKRRRVFDNICSKVEVFVSIPSSLASSFLTDHTYSFKRCLVSIKLMPAFSSLDHDPTLIVAWRVSSKQAIRAG
jgi:hypothetical protein